MDERKKQKNQNEQNERLSQGTKNQSKTSNEIIISVVIPLYNEEASIEELGAKLESVLAPLTKNRYEVIFVDDGSTDNSRNKIRELHRRNNRFHCISFRRNYGKSAALAVGFQTARGRYIVTMDADLQDDPEEIPNLIKKLNEGYDLVSGWKKKRYDPITKTLPSKLFNFVTSLVSGIRLHDFNCGLKAYRNIVVKRLNVYGEMHRYLPVLAHWDGFKVTEIPVRHHPRKYGKSKFGSGRFIKGFLDLLTVMVTTRYMQRPLHFFGTIGTLITLLGFVINLYLIVEWLMGKTYLSNRPLLLFGITLIIFGVQLISIGLLGEMNIKSKAEKINYNIRDKF
ncbi:glycosyltransferase [Bacteroidetes/Chlorobi group bacterium Naka2016]|jgi:glycosyltransferase involved in cell wall biosynthesis|nr:MAG: glycosyltransferase [Bacteroidetes/Chlorobi group bacterium Naka2016]